ncbi:MAG: tRNA (adenosine(37)-N6)-threonylcarbamoyltransferase complex transferase subunit TsaD, partial [Candidatus Ornithomonoglobus sp.]
VTDALCAHTIEAAKRRSSKTIVLAGGVASNSALREKMTLLAGKQGMTVLFPPPVLCTDNAVMIAAAGYFEYISGIRADLKLNAVPSLPLE